MDGGDVGWAKPSVKDQFLESLTQSTLQARPAPARKAVRSQPKQAPSSSSRLSSLLQGLIDDAKELDTLQFSSGAAGSPAPPSRHPPSTAAADSATRFQSPGRVSKRATPAGRPGKRSAPSPSASTLSSSSTTSSSDKAAKTKRLRKPISRSKAVASPSFCQDSELDPCLLERSQRTSSSRKRSAKAKSGNKGKGKSKGRGRGRDVNLRRLSSHRKRRKPTQTGGRPLAQDGGGVSISHLLRTPPSVSNPRPAGCAASALASAATTSPSPKRQRLPTHPVRSLDQEFKDAQADKPFAISRSPLRALRSVRQLVPQRRRSLSTSHPNSAVNWRANLSSAISSNPTTPAATSKGSGSKLSAERRRKARSSGALGGRLHHLLKRQESEANILLHKSSSLTTPNPSALVLKLVALAEVRELCVWECSVAQAGADFHSCWAVITTTMQHRMQLVAGDALCICGPYSRQRVQTHGAMQHLLWNFHLCYKTNALPADALPAPRLDNTPAGRREVEAVLDALALPHSVGPPTSSNRNVHLDSHMADSPNEHRDNSDAPGDVQHALDLARLQSFTSCSGATLRAKVVKASLRGPFVLSSGSSGIAPASTDHDVSRAALSHSFLLLRGAGGHLCELQVPHSVIEGWLSLFLSGEDATICVRNPRLKRVLSAARDTEHGASLMSCTSRYGQASSMCSRALLPVLQATEHTSFDVEMPAGAPLAKLLAPSAAMAQPERAPGTGPTRQTIWGALAYNFEADDVSVALVVGERTTSGRRPTLAVAIPLHQHKATLGCISPGQAIVLRDVIKISPFLPAEAALEDVQRAEQGALGPFFVADRLTDVLRGQSSPASPLVFGGDACAFTFAVPNMESVESMELQGSQFLATKHDASLLPATHALCVLPMVCPQWYPRVAAYPLSWLSATINRAWQKGDIVVCECDGGELEDVEVHVPKDSLLTCLEDSSFPLRHKSADWNELLRLVVGHRISLACCFVRLGGRQHVAFAVQ